MNLLTSSAALAFILTFLLAVLPDAAAATLSLKPIADAGIMAGFPNNNLGASTNIASGGTSFQGAARVLLRFDLAAAIPRSAVIVSADLKMWVNKGNSLAPASHFELHRLLVDWTEGSGSGLTGSSINEGESSWNARVAPDVNWAAPGGRGGVDFASLPSASVRVSLEGLQTFQSAPALVADLRSWLEDPASNFGWMLLCAEEQTSLTARRFASREDSVNGPVLIVTYELPPADLKIGVVRSGNASILLSWSGARAPYQVQRKADIAADWINVEGPTGEQSRLLLTAGGAGYFRVISVP